MTGLLFKDGGPVIGLQIENEYMHAGAPWEVGYPQSREYVPAGSEGSAHLQELKQLALAAGLLVPIYSCTAWGGAPVPENDFLPTQSGYAFRPWILNPRYEQPPTTEFLFLDRRAQLRVEGEIVYDTARYPYAYSELGSGTQMTYPHRPVMPPECVQAQTIVALGSGTNWLGYYMYHGGSNPIGKRFYLNEDAVPRISYDFQAPLREYGQLNASYHRLRLLHLFLQTWDAALAPMAVTLPPNHQQLTPYDTQELRCVVRSQNGSGFLFLNNYQDHVEMQDHEDIRLSLHLPGETLVIPEYQGLHVPKNASALLPFNLRLPHGVLLKYATAQLVTQLEQSDLITCVFFAPEWQHANDLHLAVYPDLPAELVTTANLQAERSEGVFSRYTLSVPKCTIPLEVQPINARVTRLRVPATALHGLHDAFLSIDYLGDIGSLYLNGRLVGDNFASELSWEIGLKRFLVPGQDLELILHISPLAQDDPKQRYLQKKIAACSQPDAKEWLEIFSIRIIPEYHARLTRRA